MKAITPKEAVKQKVYVVPDIVLEVVNQLLIDGVYNGTATIKQETIVQALVKKGFKESDIYLNGWLNIEEAYRGAGWKVEYDKPAYNESYKATFTFTAKG